MLHLLTIGTVISVTYFAIVWAISVLIKNYGLLDVAWSYSVAILAPVYAILHPGVLERQLAFTIIGTLWSVRLGTYILRRVISHHPEEHVETSDADAGARVLLRLIENFRPGDTGEAR